MKALAYIIASLLLAGIITPAAPAYGQFNGIQSSPHNLSATGRGTIRATGEQEVCVFCHNSHGTAASKGVWNHSSSGGAYKVYASTSLKAKPGQPTGSSKLCLSCHDGTIAVGNVLSKSQIQMAGGVSAIPQGKDRLGTDLSGDHPISFPYDDALATQQPTLKSPRLLPKNVPLDANRELQCTTCHDAHDNKIGKFLVMDNSHSQLCNTCHNPGTTTVLGHLDCSSCHQSHSAPSGSHLLKAAKETDTCLACHNGHTGPGRGPNIAADIAKTYHHDTASPSDQADHIPNNSTCSDCHGVHSIKSGRALAPSISPVLGDVAGVNTSGAPVAKAKFEYEVCFKCHGDTSAHTQPIGRQVELASKLQQFSPSAISSHPVEAAGRGDDVPSLAPGYSVASVIYCSDCHNSDTGPKAGGTGPPGIHGSANRGLLALEYDTADGTAESATSYALCYKCHQRSTLLANPAMTSNQPFPLHRSHVVNDKASCSICHDSHGISSGQGTARNNQHLVNFDTSIVRPDTATGRLEYDATAPRSGTCYLTCHGVAHSPLSYGLAAVAPLRAAPRRPAPGSALPSVPGPAGGRR